MRREARDGFILEEDLAPGRMKNSGQKVKEGGFPGSVGSDDTENFPLVDMQFQLMDGRSRSCRSWLIFTSFKIWGKR